MNSIKQYKIENMSFIEVSNDSDFKVTFINFGASVYSIYYKNKLMNVQVEDPKVFLEKYIRYGKTIGRVAGRIANATYTINGATYEVDANEGRNCLHGGDCIAQRFFEIKSIENHANGTKITFHYLSKDGESGFGGNLDINVIYRVFAKSPKLVIEYEFVCDNDCPVNLTNHAYYSLGDSNINNLKLQIKSRRYAHPSYIDMICEEIRTVPLCLDFSKLKPIIQDIDNPLINRGRLSGYDHFFLFDRVDGDVKQVVLKNEQFTMNLYTDYDGIQVYTNNNEKPIKCLNTNQFRRRGVALEPQMCALSSNIIIKAGHKYHHTILLEFEENK